MLAVAEAPPVILLLAVFAILAFRIIAVLAPFALVKWFFRAAPGGISFGSRGLLGGSGRVIGQVPGRSRLGFLTGFRSRPGRRAAAAVPALGQQERARRHKAFGENIPRMRICGNLAASGPGGKGSLAGQEIRGSGICRCLSCGQQKQQNSG